LLIATDGTFMFFNLFHGNPGIRARLSYSGIYKPMDL
jgi:hypothetical protein